MMRRIVVGLALFLVLIVLALLVWIWGPFVAVAVETMLRTSSQDCISAGPVCDSYFTRLGQSGDLFGPISSLFSGLALLAVAATIWIDVSSRRASRKPVVVCQINDEDRIVFDEPSQSEPRAVRLNVALDVTAVNDVALNTTILAKLVSAEWEKSIPSTSLPVPLRDGGSPHTVQLAIRLDEQDIQRLVAAHAAGREIKLAVAAKCESLEGVHWTTAVDYVLRFRETDSDKIKALTGSPENFEKMWANQATVQAEYSVASGSWKHSK
jgi:hypothetical protein